jgi:Zn-dependent protease with chaperone function
VSTSQITLAASSAHRRGVVRLVLGLLLFAVIYVALIVGCIAAPLVLIRAAWSEPIAWLLAAPALPLFAALLFVLLRKLVHQADVSAAAIEVSTIQQPRLFEFLERLCVAACVPMPDRVRLGVGVNAAMLRSASALGLLFGGSRELVLGLGLVNTLDLRELEAVLAHELGHFAQSSARVGQWAHRTTVLLRELVLGRDHFDERLARAVRSRSIPVRWFALLLEVGVRGIRRLFGRLLGRITRSSLALARELELNADLHAVALCGSDAIVAALWRAQRAALAMNSSLAALRELAKHGILTDDLYAHQLARWAEFEQHTASSDDPMMLALRRPYQDGPSLHFPAGEAPAEVMWYSHPTYAEREANAKRNYVAPPDRSREPAWSLFDDQDALRRSATRSAYQQLGFAQTLERVPMRPAIEVEQRIADELAERAQGQQYFGFYDNRILELGDIDALLVEAEAADQASLALAVEPWRGEALEQFMQRWRATEALLEHQRQPEAEQQREQQRAEAREGDRALFRWLWRHANTDARAELERRGRFLVFVQQRIVTLNRHRNIVAPMFSQTVDRDELLDALTALHRDLAELLDAAEAVPLPDLRNLEGGTSTRAYLLAEPLIDIYDDEQPLRDWLAVFMPQVGAVHERLRTLHYKNLGQLLALRERIEQRSAVI